MGLETGTALMIAAGASAAMSGVGMFMQAQNAREQANAVYKAQAANAKLVYEEADRQEAQVNRVAQEDKSDTIRKAEVAIGTIRVAGAAAGDTSLVRMMAEVGGAEGRDLSRIEANRKASIDSLEAKKRAAQVGSNNVVTQAYNQAQSAITQSVLGFVGSGLQIATSYYARQEYLDIARNRVPIAGLENSRVGATT